MRIEKGCLNDIDGLECLYNDLNDYLETHINFPGWKKGVYPVKKTALKGIEEGNLFVAKKLQTDCRQRNSKTRARVGLLWG